MHPARFIQHAIAALTISQICSHGQLLLRKIPALCLRLCRWGPNSTVLDGQECAPGGGLPADQVPAGILRVILQSDPAPWHGAEDFPQGLPRRTHALLQGAEGFNRAKGFGRAAVRLPPPSRGVPEPGAC